MSKTYIKSERKLKEHHQPKPKVSITEMLIIAEKVAEETGHYPSYGEVQTKIQCGHIKPKDYL